MPYCAQTVAHRLLAYFLEYAEGFAAFMTVKSFGAAMDWRVLKSKEEPINLGIF